MTPEEIEKYLLNVYRCSNSKECLFGYSETIRETMDKKAFYATAEKKAYLHAEDDYGMISDGYILWVLNCLHLATSDSIDRILIAYKKAYPKLYISVGSTYTSSKATSQTEARMQKLAGNFAMCFYKQYTPIGKKRHVNIYGTMPDTVSFANQTLGKSSPIVPSLYARNAHDVLASAAASYVGSVVCERTKLRLLEIRDEMMRTDDAGNFHLPPTFRFGSVEMSYTVAFFPIYFSFDPTYQTEIDLTKIIQRRCDHIINALYTFRKRENKKGNRDGYVVAVCENEKDINVFANVCKTYNKMTDFGNIDHIYITTEGAIRTNVSIENAFVKMLKDDEGNIRLMPAVPPFL